MSDVKNYKPSSSKAYFLPGCHDKPKECVNPLKMVAFETEWKIEIKDQDGDKEEKEGVSYNLVDDSKPHQMDARGKRTGTVIKADVLANVRPEEKVRYGKKTNMRTFVLPRMSTLREMANSALKVSTDGDMTARRVNRVDVVQEVKIAKSAVTKKNGKHVDIEDYGTDTVAEGIIHLQVKMKPDKERDGVAILDMTEVGFTITKIKHNYERLTPNSTYNFDCTDTRSDLVKKEIMMELTKHARVRSKKVVSDVLKSVTGDKITPEDVARARKAQSGKVVADGDATDNESADGAEDEIIVEAANGIAASSSMPASFDMAAADGGSDNDEIDIVVADRINRSLKSDESLKAAVEKRTNDGRSEASRSHAESAVSESMSKNQQAKADAQQRLQAIRAGKRDKNKTSTSPSAPVERRMDDDEEGQ